MKWHLDDEIKPRNGHTTMVVGVVSSSVADKAGGLSLKAQVHAIKTALPDLVHGPSELKIFARDANDQRLDGIALTRLEAACYSGKFDLVIVEDLSRLSRNGAAAQLLARGAENGTRTVGLADGVDIKKS